MVTRKHIPKDSSIDTNVAPPVSMQGVRQELWSATDSDAGERVWDDQERRDFQTRTSEQASGQSARDVPALLRPGANPDGPAEQNPWDDVRIQDGVHPEAEQKVTLEHVPTVLRPGGKLETNPFKRKPIQNSDPSRENSTVPPAPSEAPPLPPTEAFTRLQVDEPEPNANPWGPSVEEPKASLGPHQESQMTAQDTGSNVWDSRAPSKQPSPASKSPAMLSLPSEGESPAWDEDELPSSAMPTMPQRSSEEQEFSQDIHAWDDVESRNKGKGPAVPTKQALAGSGPVDDWNLIDHDTAPEPISRQSTWENFASAEDGLSQPQAKSKSKEIATLDPLSTNDVPPALPPRDSVEVPSTQPPKAQTEGAANKSETYQIKNVNWFDVTATQNPRKSPILVQNANGPCPLVALVNALSLTTPAHLTNTVLVETLRSREQISLSLLLEAVFDELMSPRRSNPEVILPDVTELYTFLKGLHTGMNVNPRYIPTSELVVAHKRTSLTHVHPSERGDLIPGTFEDTRDMKLYATFSVPLIHGWLPPKDDPVYDAFGRQASSYDDVQSLLFREEELEDKLSSSSDAGLSEQEQQLYQDIMTIKSFLATSATQLTPWGLEVITKATQPGTFSILFRNDHFSTLYRHPQTLELLALVTDAGYHNHDEVVWESLVDVNGERAEFFSGDFRLVGGQQQQDGRSDVPGNWYDEAESSNAAGQGGSWQTVQRRASNNRTGKDEAAPPMSPMHEQEDRDLALALQLQEEEEERHRAEIAARRRESQLSEQFIEQQGRGITARTGPRGNARGGRGGSTAALASGRGGSNASLTPTRVSSASTGPVNIPVRGVSSSGRPVQQAPVRSLIPPINTTTRTEEDDAPPSYEQASKSTPYVPPAGHPSHAGSNLGSTSAGARRTPVSSPAGGRGSSTAGPSTPLRGRQGQPVAVNSGSTSGNMQRDRDCNVM